MLKFSGKFLFEMSFFEIMVGGRMMKVWFRKNFGKIILIGNIVVFIMFVVCAWKKPEMYFNVLGITKIWVVAAVLLFALFSYCEWEWISLAQKMVLVVMNVVLVLALIALYTMPLWL